MRRATLIVALVALASGIGYAGEYHFGANLVCSDCHTMHASLQHSYGGGVGADDFGVYPQSWTPTTYLLKGEVNDMCLACHDDGSGPDVYGSNTGPGGIANRSAGALNSALGIIAGGYDHFMGHSLWSTETAPGEAGSFDPTTTHSGFLTCVDCHHQHGYAGFGTTDVAGNPVSDAFRNLVAIGGRGISYQVGDGAGGNNDTTKDVFSDGAMEYETAQVNLNEPNPADSGFGDWCQGCHVNFHGDVGDAWVGGTGIPPAEFVRHPNAGVDIGALGGGHSSRTVFQNHLYRVRVMAPAGNWGDQGVAWAGSDDLTPTCLSCHKAHGNLQPFGLIYATGDVDPGENGDGQSRDLCKQCHVQGG